MALIVGSIISVGTFNLPTFPGGLQPDRSHLDGADDSGHARTAVHRAVVAACRLTTAVRVCAHRVQQPRGVRERLRAVGV
jgi:hypothetical protein